MVQQSEPAVFDGVFKSGEDRQQRVLVFQAHMTAFLRQEDCLDVVESDGCIKVGLAGVDHEALKKQFRPEKMGKEGRARLYIMLLVNHMPILN